MNVYINLRCSRCRSRSCHDGYKLCEKCRVYKRQYYIDNKEVLSERAKLYRDANKEALDEYGKLYRDANKEAIAERNKLYREANKEAIAERNKLYRDANKERDRKLRREKFELSILASLGK
jgi:esterase/lipase